MTESIPQDVTLSGSRAALDEVCVLLATPSPQALHAAAGILGRVVAEMAEARGRRDGVAQRQQYRGIRRAAQVARILLEKAKAYHAGWNSRLGSLTEGYGPGGAAAAPMMRGRLSIEG